MKFEQKEFWKHENCMDVFFRVREVYDDHYRGGVVAHGTWCTQGRERWWFTYDDVIHINNENYNLWHPYEPQGKIKL